MTKVILNTKISEVKNKIPNHDKYITIPEFSKLSAESYAARLMRADLLRKTDFDNKQTSFNEQITSNKAKHLEALKKLSSLITKDYNFSLGRMYFTIYTWYFRIKKKDKGKDYVLSLKSEGEFSPNLDGWAFHRLLLVSPLPPLAKTR